MTEEPRVMWKDPSRVRKGHGFDWLGILEELTQNPDRWAVIYKTDSINKASALGTQLRKGKRRIPPGRWEFTSRSENGGGYLYARYLGSEE